MPGQFTAVLAMCICLYILKFFFLQKLRHYTCAANVPTKPEQHCSGGSPAEDSKYLPDYTTH